MVSPTENLSAWTTVLSKAEIQAKLDSQFIFRSYFPAPVEKQLELKFAEEAGKKYQFKLISRKLDSVAQIDMIPQSNNNDKELPIMRISEAKFEKQDDSFVYSFTYSPPMGSTQSNIILKGVDYDGMREKDFVIFVYRLD